MNPQVPFTHGSTTIALKHVDHLIWNPFVLPEPNLFEPTPADLKIGDLVAEMVTDGATLQLGIGSIPNAIGKSLKNHKNLGIHSEMINDAMLELAELGVIDGSMKTLWRGKMVGSFAYGSRKLYDFINKNPAVELHPASVINDVDRIAKNHKMTSVNSAIEIDLTGQVCSESIGHKEISGVGGASETHIGAQKSKHGQAIIAMKSSAKGNSKIVFELQRGAKVSVSRNDIDTVVTEYGVARLKGQSVCERAKSLISIAHPDFRDDLTRLAKDQNYI
jgi:acyl-CoA hydrolase